MLKNFILDADLLRYYPLLENYKPLTQDDYSPQITEAFNIVNDDLYNAGFKPRQLMLPIDLLRAANSSALQNTLTPSTDSANASKTHVNGLSGFRRFCVKASALTGSQKVFTIKGSNDQGVTDSTEPSNWDTIESVTLDAVGEESVVVEPEYKYYKVEVATTSGSVTWTAGLYEVWADRLIIHKAVELIGISNRKEKDDFMDMMAANAGSLYESALSSAKMYVDSNDDNLPSGDESENTAQPEFFR